MIISSRGLSTPWVIQKDICSRCSVSPCNVGYHIEHHWYPSVPFYRLPDLHKELMAREGFRRHAVVRRSILASLGECLKPQIVE